MHSPSNYMNQLTAISALENRISKLDDWFSANGLQFNLNLGKS